MSQLAHYLTRFQSGNYYHIYNRGVDRKLIYRTRSNHLYFMRLWQRYMEGYLDVISYSLNANHFHFLVRVRHFNEAQLGGKSEHELVASRLKMLFRTYALAFNRNHGRTGSLFDGPYKRVLVEDSRNLSYLVQYIHVNPEKNKLVLDFRTWDWSSYKFILSPRKSIVDRKFVLEWFGGIKEFVLFHSKENQEVDISTMLSDDE
jgi:putative transposase